MLYVLVAGVEAVVVVVVVVVALAVVVALVVEEEEEVTGVDMTTIKDLDPAMDLVVVGLEIVVVLAAEEEEDLDHRVVAVVDLEGIEFMSFKNILQLLLFADVFGLNLAVYL